MEDLPTLRRLRLPVLRWDRAKKEKSTLTPEPIDAEDRPVQAS
jgi:hypothetical protein